MTILNELELDLRVVNCPDQVKVEIYGPVSSASAALLTLHNYPCHRTCSFISHLIQSPGSITIALLLSRRWKVFKYACLYNSPSHQIMNMDESGLGRDEEGQEKLVAERGEKRPFHQQVRKRNSTSDCWRHTMEILNFALFSGFQLRSCDLCAKHHCCREISALTDHFLEVTPHWTACSSPASKVFVCLIAKCMATYNRRPLCPLDGANIDTVFRC